MTNNERLLTMISKLSDLINQTQSIDFVLSSIVKTSKFEDLARSYRLRNFDFDCQEIRNQSAIVKCFQDRLEIYQTAEDYLVRHLATIWIPKVGKPSVTTYSEEGIIDREDFINDLRQILS